MESEDKFSPERIEPFAKMSQMGLKAPQEPALPVKFRRNVFEDSTEAHLPPPQPQVDMFHKPPHHMRAQPRVPYSSMDPEQRRQAELLDTAVARQELLLRQQQEVLAFAHRQQVEQRAQQLVNTSLAPPTAPKAPPATRVNQQQALNALLNEACFLAPQAGVMSRVGWVPPQPVMSTVLGNPVTTLGARPGSAAVVTGPPPGAPGSLTVIGQEELMQAVRKELKRLQQE